MRIFTTFLLAFMMGFTLSSQNAIELTKPQEQPVYFEGLALKTHGACISKELRAKIEGEAETQITKLRKEGKLSGETGTLKNLGSLQWPLRVKNNYNECGYYSIFQYFDHNPATSSAFGNLNTIQDWNCGTITYDVTGYNHSGTDIGISPFGWNMMENENVEVVAAASGIIVAKNDGNFDKECNGFSSTTINGNYLMIVHSDQSRSLYNHMKSGSVTQLNIGDNINVGDYIGLVGSSGAATGPHLHFEIQDAQATPIDPYGGPCNSVNGSLWASQHNYYEKSINRLITHSAQPSTNTCPNLETINEQLSFVPGTLVGLGSYLSHAQPQDTYTITLLRPDGTTFSTFNLQSPSQFFPAYSYYTSRFIPLTEQTGNWTFRLDTNYGDSCSKSFFVGTCAQDEVLSGLTPVGVGVISIEAANSIVSTALIGAGEDVTYDAGNCVQLDSGFEVQPGAIFEALIDGCGGL